MKVNGSKHKNKSLIRTGFCDKERILKAFRSKFIFYSYLVIEHPKR